MAAASVDIKSAFDMAWLSAIIDAHAKRHCPVYPVKIVKSYFENRRAFFQFHTELVHQVNIGCAQGSVLSPFLWAILIDDALRVEHPFKCIIVAFPDDITIASIDADPGRALLNLQLM